MNAHSPSHFRSFAGLLLGFVVFISCGVLGSMAIPSAFGPDQLFEPGLYSPTPLFLGLQIALAFAAAFLAGYLCRLVTIVRKPALLLAAVVFVLGFTHALFTLSSAAANPLPRTGQENAEVMQAQILAKQPAWYTILQPLLLAGGIIIGSGRRFKSQS